MIFGIGTDIVNVARMADSYARLGEKFAQRILADVEYEAFKTNKHPASFLAKRFAAKEAAAKAFGTGFRQGLSLKHIAVTHDELGRPQLAFYDVADQLKQQFNISEAHLSLSDERDVAVAFVILLKK